MKFLFVLIVYFTLFVNYAPLKSSIYMVYDSPLPRVKFTGYRICYWYYFLMCGYLLEILLYSY